MRAIDLPLHRSGHSAPITHVAFRRDGRRMATCSYDGTVLIWDTTDPADPRRPVRLRHRRLVNAAAWSPAAPDMLATASADKTAVVWRITADDAQPVAVMSRHTDDVNAVAWTPDGRRLVCVSEDGRATLWDASTGAFLAELGGHTAHCMMVAVNGAGLAATVGEDGMVVVHDLEHDTTTASRHYPASIEGCAWSHSSGLLAVARDDGVVDLLTPALETVRSMPVASSAARSVAWTADDSRLAIGAYDGAVHVVDVHGRFRRRIAEPRLWPRSVSVAGGLLAVGSFADRAHVYDLDTGTPRSGPQHPTHGVNAMTTRGHELVIGCDSGTVAAIDLRTPTDTPPVRLLAGTRDPVLSLAAHGETVYAGTYAGRVVRCTPDRVSSDVLGAPLPALGDTPDGLVAGIYQGELVRLDPGTLEVTGRVAGHEGSVKSLARLGDDLVSASTDRRVAAGPFDRRRTLWEHGNLVNAVATLGGRVVASAARDHTVQAGLVTRDDTGVWRTERRQTLLGPDESVKAVTVLGRPAAPVVLAGSYDFGLYAWRVDWGRPAEGMRTGRLVAEFGQGVSCLLRLDERRAVAAGWDGRLLVVGLDRTGAVGVERTFSVEKLLARVPARPSRSGGSPRLTSGRSPVGTGPGRRR